MADLSDVQNALKAIALSAVYPNGTSNSSITGVTVSIGLGWPKPDDLDRVFALNPPQSMVTIFPVPGATGKSVQFFEPPVILIPPVHGMRIARSGNQITISGNPGVGEYLTFIVNKANIYSRAAGSTDTASSMALALANLVAVDYPGTSASGPIVTVASPARNVVARVGAPGTMGRLIHRQRQQIRISIWSPNPTDRTTISAALDVAYKQNLHLSLNDSQAILTYESTIVDDNTQNQGEYRRDLVYCIEYGTLETFQAYEVTSFSIDLTSQGRVVIQ
jgi:hypothetical protein